MRLVLGGIPQCVWRYRSLHPSRRDDLLEKGLAGSGEEHQDALHYCKPLRGEVFALLSERKIFCVSWNWAAVRYRC